MTCDECQRILVDETSRRAKESRKPDVSLLSLAELHAQSCVFCADWPSDLARLHAGFDRLRSCTNQMEAPARVEKNLLGAFRQSTEPNASWMGRNFGRLVLASAAAVLVLLFAIGLYATLRPKPGMTAQGDSVRKENKSSEQALPKQRSPVAGQAARAIPKRVRGSANHRRPGDNLMARGDPAAGHLTQPVRALSLNGGSSVIRVNLPLSSLAAVGIPMYADLPDRQVTADVALDPFGAIIAIRLVGISPGEGALSN